MAQGRRAEILLLVSTVLVCGAVAEVAVRWLAADVPRPTGYAPVWTKGRDVWPRNALGYRDLERSRAKPPGVKRVVSLGDSFAWGSRVEWEDAYPYRLGRRLRMRRGEPWEVVNLAMPGMNTVEQARQLAAEGMAYEPDVVVLGYCLNDAEDREAYRRRHETDLAQRAERRAARREGRPLPPASQSAPDGWAGHSALFRFVASRLSATAQNRQRIRDYRALYADDAPGWVAGRRSLAEMGAACRERRIPFVVVIFPLFGNPLDESYPFAELHTGVASAATRAGAQVVDLLPAYRGLRWELLVADGVEDEHPNEIAHRIAADVLVGALDEALPWRARAAPR